MAKNNYEQIANKLTSAAKEISEKKKCEGIHNQSLWNNTKNVILDTGVSCDGSFSSNNDVFVA